MMWKRLVEAIEGLTLPLFYFKIISRDKKEVFK